MCNKPIWHLLVVLVLTRIAAGLGGDPSYDCLDQLHALATSCQSGVAPRNALQGALDQLAYGCLPTYSNATGHLSMSSGPLSTVLQQASIASSALGSINPDIYANSNTAWQAMSVPNKLDTPSGWVLDASAQGQLVGSSRLQDLSLLVAGDNYLEWQDVSPFYRDYAATFNGRVVGIPVGGDTFSLYYRRDLFAAAQLAVPITWQLLVDAAARLNGTFSNPAGRKGFGFCFGCVASDLLPAIWASLVQTQGTAQGVYFDLSSTGQPMSHSPLVQVAVSWLQALAKYAPVSAANGTSSGQACSGVAGALESTTLFDTGGCAITFGWTAQFKLSSHPSNPLTSISGNVGIAAIPGSVSVWDPSTQQVVRCNSSSCPTATETVLEGGVISLVNRAPLPRAAAALVALNVATPPEVSLRAYSFARELSIPSTTIPTTSSSHTSISSISRSSGSSNSGSSAYPITSSWATVLNPKVPLGPFRSTHTDPANSTTMWVGAGYPLADVVGFLTTVRHSLGHPNAVMQLRVPMGEKYSMLLSDAAKAAVSNLSALPLDIIAVFISGLESLYGSVAGVAAPQLHTSLVAYQASLVLRTPQPTWPRWYLTVQPSSPSAPALPSPPQTIISTTQAKSVQLTLTIALAICLPVLLAAAVGLILYIKVSPAVVGSRLQKLGHLKFSSSHVQQQLSGKDSDMGSRGTGDGKSGSGALTASEKTAAIASARSSRRRKRFGVVMPPSTSPYSTLVITDIQDSTHLWETLPPAVMDCSLKLHHVMFRELMLKHTGYEAATEGDSFIIGFHTSSDACLFALESQQKLLDLPWPKELLEAPVCAPVYVMPRDDDRKGQSTFRGLEQTVGTNSLRILKRSYATSPLPSSSTSFSLVSLICPWLHSDSPLKTKTIDPRPVKSRIPTPHCPVVPSARADPKLARLQALAGRGRPKGTLAAPQLLPTVTLIPAAYPAPRVSTKSGPAVSTPSSSAHISIILGDATSGSHKNLSLEDGFADIMAESPSSPSSPKVSMPPELSAAYQHHSLTLPSDDDVSNHKIYAKPAPHTLKHIRSLQRTPAASETSGATPDEPEAVYTVGHIPIPDHIIPTSLTDPPPPPPCNGGGNPHNSLQQQADSDPQQEQQGQHPGTPASGSGGGRSDNAAMPAAHSLLTLVIPSMHQTPPAPEARQWQAGTPQQQPARKRNERNVPEMAMKMPSSSLTTSMAAGLMSPRASTALPTTLFSTTLGSVMDEYWAPVVMSKPGAVLVLRGLRVRIGLHSGIASVSETAFNAASRRTTYCGVVLATAKAVADSGNGGMITLSPTSLVALEEEGGKALAHGVVHHLGRFLITPFVPCMDLHVIYPEALLARASILQPLPLRVKELLQPGVLSAPLGCVCVAALHVVGAPTLLAWNERLAGAGLEMVRHVALEELRTTQGYLYEYSPGFLHAAFQSPRQAVQWALKTSSALVYAHWDATLLMHELCEEIVFAHEDETNAEDIEDEEILFKGPRLKGGIAMGAIKADLSSSSGHVTYKGQAVVSLHRLLSEAKTSQVLCTDEVQRRCGLPLPPARALSHPRVSSSRPLRSHHTPSALLNLPQNGPLLPPHFLPKPQRAASQLGDFIPITSAAASHSSPGFTTGLKPYPQPSRLHDPQQHDPHTAGHSTACPRLSPLSRSVFSASAYSMNPTEGMSDHHSPDTSMCDISVKSNPISQAIATEEAANHGSSSAPGNSTQTAHCHTVVSADHGETGSFLHSKHDDSAVGDQQGDVGHGQSPETAVAAEDRILCEQQGEERQIESFHAQVVFFQLAPVSSAARGWTGLTSAVADGGPTYQCRLLLPYVPEGAYMLQVQENAPRASSTQDLSAMDDHQYGMVGELREGRSTLSEGQTLMLQNTSSPTGTLPASCRSSTTKGNASNPSSRRVSGRRNSVIILSRHNSSARGNSTHLAGLLGGMMMNSGMEDSPPAMHHLRNSGQPMRTPRSRMASAAMYGPLPPQYHENMLLMRGSGGGSSHAPWRVEHQRSLLLSAATTSTAPASPATHDSQAGGLLRSAGSATSIQKPYSFFAHRSSSAIHRGTSWNTSQYLSHHPGVGQAVPARPASSIVHHDSSGGQPSSSSGSRAQPAWSRSHSLSPAPRPAAQNHPALGGGVQQPEPHSRLAAAPLQHWPASPSITDRSKIRRSCTLSHTNTRPHSGLGQNTIGRSVTIARSTISPAASQHPLSRETSINSYSSYAYAYYSEQALISPPASDIARTSTSPFPLSGYTNLSHVYEARDSNNSGSDHSLSQSAPHIASLIQTGFPTWHQPGNNLPSNSPAVAPASPSQARHHSPFHQSLSTQSDALLRQRSSAHLNSPTLPISSPAATASMLQRSAGISRRTSIMVNLVSAADILATLSTSQHLSQPETCDIITSQQSAPSNILWHAGGQSVDNQGFSSFPYQDQPAVTISRTASTGRPVVVRGLSLTGGFNTTRNPQSSGLPFVQAQSSDASKQQQAQSSVWLPGGRGPMSRSGRMSSPHLPGPRETSPSPGQSHSGGGAAPGSTGSGLLMYPQYGSNRGPTRTSQQATSWSGPQSRDLLAMNAVGLLGTSPTAATESYLASSRDALTGSPRSTDERGMRIPGPGDTFAASSYPSSLYTASGYPRQVSHRFTNAQTLTTLGEEDGAARRSPMHTATLPSLLTLDGIPIFAASVLESASSASTPAVSRRVNPLVRAASSAASSLAAVLSMSGFRQASSSPPPDSPSHPMWLHTSNPNSALQEVVAPRTNSGGLSTHEEERDSNHRLFERPSSPARAQSAGGGLGRHRPVLSPFQTLSSQSLMPASLDCEDADATVAIPATEGSYSDPL